MGRNELTAFSINGEPISSFTRSARYQVTDTTVIASKHFQLSYHDNSFALQLSTLTYDNPEHITYLYSINGENFVRLQPGINEITFSHMPPGTYKFKVKAERNNMETPVREFTVVVHSPWYRSTWAYLFYALLLGLGLWQFLVLQKRKQQDRLRLQEHIHAEEMGEAKLRFFMNISHEIRTPMTLILTPLLTLMKEDGDPHRRDIYKTIKRNAERILHLINQMMDLRKIDKGMMQMRMKETDLVEFVRDIHTLFETQAKTKSINLSYEHDSDKLPVWIDRGNFDKIVMNILSNAFKYTPNGGEINIKLTHDDHNASLAISDDGEKIPEELLTKIFERFYQSSSTANDRHTGTGIGLDLTRSLVELHHGTIKAQNLEKDASLSSPSHWARNTSNPRRLWIRRQLNPKLPKPCKTTTGQRTTLKSQRLCPCGRNKPSSSPKTTTRYATSSSASSSKTTKSRHATTVATPSLRHWARCPTSY